MWKINSLSPEELDNMAYLGRDQFFLREFKNWTALTYDDVTLATLHSSILPKDANVATRLHNLLLPIPIISADMDTVTGPDMAIAMARSGGLGIIHYNMTSEAQIDAVAKVKHNVHGVTAKPIAVRADQKVGDVMKMQEEKGYNFGTFPVLDKDGKLIWLIGSNVLQNIHRNKNIKDVMTKRTDIVAITPEELWKDPIATAKRFFEDNVGKNKLLIVDGDNNLKWLITLSDVERISKEAMHSTIAQDSQHRLLVWAALSTQRDSKGRLDKEKLISHAEKLILKWVDALALSSAHAHTKSAWEAIALIRKKFPDITIIAGNVTSAKGVEFVARNGANVIKIWQGPGSICTTRDVAGVGIPQLSAVAIASMAAEQLWVQIIADGGINKSWSMVKAFAAWADAVMLGSLLGWADEAPGDILVINGEELKSYRGMGSMAAMRDWSAIRYGHNPNDVWWKTAAEWVSAYKPRTGPVSKTLAELVGGVQSGMWYHWAKKLSDLRKKARFAKMTPAGRIESSPHDIIQVQNSTPKK